MTRNLCAILLSASILPVSAPAAASTDSTTDGALVRDGAVVNCSVGRRAVVRRAVVNGRAVDRVRCVRTVRASQVRGERRRYHRSWKKTAAVIGGSTAAGAGVGALVGGKKGAAIGGATGAAAGTAYEVHKRRKHRRR